MPEPAHSAQPLAARDDAPPCLATIRSVAAGDRMNITCRGELDIGARRLGPELSAVLDRSATGVDLDLDGIGFCDCGGLNVLLSLRRDALDQGKTVTVRACSPSVGRLLDLTGARELFTAEGPGGSEGSGDSGDAKGPAISTDSEQPESPDSTDTSAPDNGSRPVNVDQELRLEVAQLRRAMRTRPAIDVARGIVMASFGLSSDDAWTVLVHASQNTNTKLHHLAQDLMDAVHGEPVRDEVRQQMAAAVARVREAPPGAGPEGPEGPETPP